MRITLKQNRIRTGLIFLGLTLAVGLFVAVLTTTQRISHAAPVPESCFTFDSVAGAITGYNPADDPLCVSDVDIPATIGGVPVAIIGYDTFLDDTITSVNFPDSITTIESGAFTNIGTTLSSVALDVSGDLLIQDGAFGAISGGSVSISADGMLEYRSNFSNSTLTSLSLNSGTNLLAKNSSTPITSIDTLTLTAAGSMTVEASALSGSTVGSVALSAGGNILIESGGLKPASYDTLEISSGGDVTVVGSISGSSSSVGMLDIVAGNELNILSGAFSNIASLTSASLSAGTGTLNIEDGSMSSITTLTTLVLTAPSGLNIADGSLDNLPALTSLTFPSLGGNVYIYGLTSTGLTALDLTTSGSVTITYGSFDSISLTSFDVTAGSDLYITFGTLSGALGSRNY